MKYNYLQGIHNRLHQILLFGLSVWSFSIQAQTPFREVSKEVGIEAFHQDADLMGGGATFFDYNNDGWQDLFITGGSQSNKLFKNLGNKTFVEVTQEAGLVLDFVVINSTGVIAGDVNNDGFDDLFISTFEGFANQLYLNNGDGTFSDISFNAGIRERSNSRGASFIDVNEDGYIDIYVPNYVESLTFIIDDNELITGFGHNCYRNFLYINNGDLTFTESAIAYGVSDVGCGLAVAATDLNRDGHTDLYVANDFGFWLTPNRAYLNLNPGFEFTRVDQPGGLDSEIYARGIAVGDVDNNRLPDYYITNIGPNHFLTQGPPVSFTEQAQSYEIQNDSIGNKQITSWGTFFFDFDHDLDLDLFVSNGFLTNLELLNTVIQDPDQLFVNNGDGSFTSSESFGTIASSQPNRGAVYADFDQDGDLDIYSVATNDSPVPNPHGSLYENQGASGNWLIAKLVGVTVNRNAYGALVELFSDGLVLERELYSGGSYGSQSSQELHFGLGQIEKIDSLVIHWGSGQARETIHSPPVNRRIRVTQGAGSFEVRGCGGAPCDDLTLNVGLASLPITIHPNPFLDRFEIVSEQHFDKDQIRLYNLNGKDFSNHLVVHEESPLVLSSDDLPAGVYLLEIINHQGTRYTQRVIKN